MVNSTNFLKGGKMKFNSKVKFTLSEAEHQEKIFNWAKYVPELKWMFAIPNGGYRRPLEALRLKQQGVKAGVSDIFLPLPRGGYHGLFIELKVGKNKPTNKQIEFLGHMWQLGYQCEVCYGSDEAIKKINEYIRQKNN